MRVMHLSDLHLGLSIMEQSLIEDQKYILNEIINVIKNKDVEVVMICGDIYDKNVPSVEAVKLFNDFLISLSNLKVKVLVIAGNHDSRDRLIFGSELFKKSDIYIEGIYTGKVKKVSFNDEYGKINFFMLPFVKPTEVRKYFGNRDISSYDDMINCIICNEEINMEERNVIMVHQFVISNGVSIVRSDSEVISLGGLDNVDVSNFDSFDYVAMGHIHGPQKLIRNCVRYSGSPLKYSFSEVNQKKSVVVIDFGKKGNVDIELVDLKPIRDMRVIKGPIDKLLDKSVYSLGNVDDYISVILTDNDYIVDAIGKLRGVYKNVLRVSYDNMRSNSTDFISDSFDSNVKLKGELELFSDFYKLQNNIDMDNERFSIISNIIDDLNDK